MTDILSSTQLKKLKEHQYSATGTSIIEPYMQVFWRWLVEQIPTTWAPNTITVVGLLMNIVSTAFLVIFSPDCKTEAPRIFYFICALGLFIYQSLDAIDGKQARRTKTNSPLGELFDHGCDAVSTAFVTLGMCCGLGLGTYPWLMMFEVFFGVYLFYQAHWQTYVTGTLVFSKVDVTEAQFGVIFVYLFSAFFGVGFWAYKIPLLGLEFKQFIVVVTIVPALIQVKNNISVILSGGKGKNKATIADTSTIFPVLPIAIVLVMGVMIAIKSTSSLYLQYPSIYLLSFGLVGAKVTNRLVVAHMTKSEMAMVDSSLLGPTLLFFNQYFNTPVPEYIMLWICFIFTSYDLINYSRSVCQEICDYLGIYCFDITSKPEKVRSTSHDS